MEKYVEMTVDNASQHDEQSHVQAAKFRSVSTVLTAVVVVAGLLGVAFIVTNGNWTGEDCPSNKNTETMTKMADSDMAMNINLMQDGEMFPQRFTYDHESNTVLLETAGNFSGNTGATMALDFDRRLAFINVHDQNKCVAFQLPEQIMDAAKKSMDYGEDQIIDVSTMHFSLATVEATGEIPYDYVQTSHGPIIRDMCFGQSTYWSDFNMAPSGHIQKRLEWTFCGCISIVCVCVTITIDI